MRLKKHQSSNSETARNLGVTEGAIRYRIKRISSGAIDKRKVKESEADKFKAIIESWIAESNEEDMRPTIRLMHDVLRDEYSYGGCYASLKHYLHKNYPDFIRKRGCIRIETPPGRLAQVDWKEGIKVQLGEKGRWVTLNALIMTLCFSRKSVIIFSEKKSIDAFLCCHQQAFAQLGGLPAMMRTDCLKSAVIQWRGRESIINERYKRYLLQLGIDVFPARPGRPQDKGKVEKRIQDIEARLNLKYCVYEDIWELHNSSRKKLLELEKQWRSGATGRTVEESFSYEQKELRALPEHFPHIPIEEKTCKVRDDGTIDFCNNHYQVSAAYRGHRVLCINTGTHIVIYWNGAQIGSYVYLPKSKGMMRVSREVLVDQSIKISPLLRMWGIEFAERQVEIYHQITRGGSQ